MSYLTHADAFVWLIRVSLGCFFACTGYRKLFVPTTHEKLVELFKRLGVYNKFVEWSVPTGELLGGLALAWGFLTPVAACGLIVILMGAVCLDCWKEIEAKHPTDGFDWTAKVLYTPEILMLIMLFGLVFVGDDLLSWDAIIRRYWL